LVLFRLFNPENSFLFASQEHAYPPNYDFFFAPKNHLRGNALPILEAKKPRRLNKMSEKIEPTEKFKQGLVSAALFVRKVKGKTGTFDSKSVVLQKSYKNDKGNWVNNSLTLFAKDDIDNAIRVLTQMKEVL
jgi:hypothetical protein